MLVVTKRRVRRQHRPGPGNAALSPATPSRATCRHPGHRTGADSRSSDRRPGRIDCVRQVIRWGATFDRVGRDLAFGLEGGHSQPRILHAGGDATGRELERALYRKARASRRITFREHTFTLDLLQEEGGRVAGAVVADPGGRLSCVAASAAILATGGAGQLYRETTNPDVVTGDGIAMALRLGAEVTDLEFVQFHPTTLYVAGAARMLISEAARGEGGAARPQRHRLHSLRPADPRPATW